MLMALYHVRDLAIWQQEQEVLDNTKPWLQDVIIYGDSQLVTYQLNSLYKVRDEDLKPLWLEAINLVNIIREEHNVYVRFVWIPRNVNNKALGLEDKHIVYDEDEVINEIDSNQ